LGYGPDVYFIGPTLFAGYFSLMDPSLLKKGGHYLVTTTSNLYNDGDPVVYDVTIPDVIPCDPLSSAPNQCFNAAGDASVCCAGAVRRYVRFLAALSIERLWLLDSQPC
jgi:hypothetical protein